MRFGISTLLPSQLAICTVISKLAENLLPIVFLIFLEESGEVSIEVLLCLHWHRFLADFSLLLRLRDHLRK